MVIPEAKLRFSLIAVGDVKLDRNVFAPPPPPVAAIVISWPEGVIVMPEPATRVMVPVSPLREVTPLPEPPVGGYSA